MQAGGRQTGASAPGTNRRRARSIPLSRVKNSQRPPLAQPHLIVPGLSCEACAYVYASAARPFFDVLINWNVYGGLPFSFVAMGVTVGRIDRGVHRLPSQGWPLDAEDSRIQFRVVFQQAVEHEGSFPRPARDRLLVKRQAVVGGRGP